MMMMMMMIGNAFIDVYWEIVSLHAYIISIFYVLCFPRVQLERTESLDLQVYQAKM